MDAEIYSSLQQTYKTSIYCTQLEVKWKPSLLLVNINNGIKKEVIIQNNTKEREYCSEETEYCSVPAVNQSTGVC